MVSPKLFAVYDERLLHASLATMEDLAWCPQPHCRSAVLLDRKDGALDQLGRCSVCSHAFCALSVPPHLSGEAAEARLIFLLALPCRCKKSFHGYEPCSSLRSQWIAADEETRQSLRQRFGDRVVGELESHLWIEGRTKRCPSCQAPVEKNGGCNHMYAGGDESTVRTLSAALMVPLPPRRTCKKCGQEWCWLCLRPYTVDHYVASGCQQFTEDFFAVVDILDDS